MYLTQNREMKRDGVWNFTLPAWVIELPDESHFNVCPQAGACAKFCYARNGTYLFPKVRGKHLNNLLDARDDPAWTQRMIDELASSKFRARGERRVIPGLSSVDHLSNTVKDWIESGGQAVRIHDSGDFFSREYLHKWLDIAATYPQILFYCYTKEVRMFKDEPSFPANFLHLFSMGGRQDHLVNVERDRHADVFPDLEHIEKAGYASQHESDLLAVLLPSNKIGIPQNNIPHFKKRLAGRTFAEAQRDRGRK